MAGGQEIRCWLAENTVFTPSTSRWYEAKFTHSWRYSRGKSHAHETESSIGEVFSFLHSGEGSDYAPTCFTLPPRFDGFSGSFIPRRLVRDPISARRLVRRPEETVLDATRRGFWASLDHPLYLDGNLGVDGVEIFGHGQGQGGPCHVLVSAPSECFLVSGFLWVAPHGARLCQYYFPVVDY